MSEVLDILKARFQAWLKSVKVEPVRAYAFAVALVALVAIYVPSLPSAAILAVVAAALGVGGEAVRRRVTPVSKKADSE